MNRLNKNLKADYGIDAPIAIRNLFLCGIAGLIIWIITNFGLLPDVLKTGSIAGVNFEFPLNSIALFCGIIFNFTGFWMIWSSKIGKLKMRDKLLSKINWSGNESVLDIGCGRGLMVIGAAKKLTSGKAYGVDIWQGKDLSGNSYDSTMKNVDIENVSDKVFIKTADMRELPFEDGSIDIVISSTAIHNLKESKDRSIVIKEIVRVLKPGGIALIDDIRFSADYKNDLLKYGCKDAEDISSFLSKLFTILITFGSLRPGTIKAKK